MIWIVAAALLFLVFAGVRLLRSAPPAGGEQPDAEPADALPAGPLLVMGEGDDAPSVVLAGRARRAVARLIDTFLVLGISVTGSVVIGAAAGLGGENLSGLRWAVFFIVVLTHAAFEIGFVGTTGQTPGKMAMKIHVVELMTARTPSYGRAAVRWLLPALAGVVAPVLLSPSYLDGSGGPPSSPASLVAYGAGALIYAWGLLDPLHQGIHDKVARTLVAVRV